MDIKIHTGHHNVFQVLLLLPLFVVLSAGYPSARPSKTRLYCPAGERLIPGLYGRPDRCEPCTEGFFMSDTRHRHTKCWECWSYNPYSLAQIFLHSCTRTRNTQIKCRTGFYLGPDPIYLDCYSCMNCSRWGLFEAQPCSWNEDTKCCAREDELFIDGKCTVPPRPSTVNPHDMNWTNNADTTAEKPLDPPDGDENLDSTTHSAPLPLKRDGTTGALLLIPLAFLSLVSFVAFIYGWQFLVQRVAPQWV